MAAFDGEALHGRWAHSHEDDTDSEQVFRPADYPFPPSRGRTELELRRDGTYVESGPGPVDAPVERAAGQWSMDGDALVLGPGGGGQAERIWRITRATKEQLVVRR